MADFNLGGGGFLGPVIGFLRALQQSRGGDGLRFDPRIIAEEIARRRGETPPPRPPPPPRPRPPGAPVRGSGPGRRQSSPSAPPFVGQPPPDYFAPGWDQFMACATRAGRAAVHRGESTDQEIADAIFRECGPRPRGRIPDEFDDVVIPKVPTASAGPQVFLPTIPEVVPVIVPAVREIIRRAIPIIVPMLPDFFPEPAPEPIPRGPTKRPRVRPPVETPELFPIEIDPAWRVIHPYPIPAPFPQPTPVEQPRRGPQTRPRIAPRPSPPPRPAPSTRPVGIPSPAPTPRRSPFRLPKALPYLLPFAYPLLFPTGPQVFPFQLAPPIPQPTPRPKPPRVSPGQPGGFPDPLTPIQPIPVPFTSPLGFRNPADKCVCTETKPERKPRKPRTECREGTYRETSRGTFKNPRRKIPCR